MAGRLPVNQVNIFLKMDCDLQWSCSYLYFYSSHFILVIPLCPTVRPWPPVFIPISWGGQPLPSADPSDRTFVKSFNLLEMKITKLFFFQCDKIAWRSLGRTKQPGHSSSRLSDFPPCPVDLIKLAIPEKAQIFGFKMHSEKKVIKIKTECCCSHGLLLKHKLRHYY